MNIICIRDDSENDAVKLRDMKLVMRDMNLSNDKWYVSFIIFPQKSNNFMPESLVLCEFSFLCL